MALVNSFEVAFHDAGPPGKTASLPLKFREEFDAEVSSSRSQLLRIEREAGQGDIAGCEEELRQIIDRLKLATARWPTSVALKARLAGSFVALANVRSMLPDTEFDARALGTRAVALLRPLEKAIAEHRASPSPRCCAFVRPLELTQRAGHARLAQVNENPRASASLPSAVSLWAAARLARVAAAAARRARAAARLP